MGWTYTIAVATGAVAGAHRKSFREMVSRPTNRDRPGARNDDCSYIEIIFHLFPRLRLLRVLQHDFHPGSK
jgi:hypothetical protein